MDVHSLPLRIYFIPYCFFSHLFSLFELSRLFAVRGHLVTILTTPSNIKLFQKSMRSTETSDQNIHFHELNFPSKEVGLPDGIENVISVDDFDTAFKVYRGMNLLQTQMEEFMEQNPPDCIVSDMYHPWTADFANRFEIPRLHFDCSSIFHTCLFESIRGPDSPHRKLTSESEPFLIPGFPHPITMTLSQLQDYVKTPDQGVFRATEEFREGELKSYGRLVNGFAEIEQEYIQHYQKTMRINVWHVGPTSLLNRTVEAKANRSMKTVVSEHECLSWLNCKPPNSVLYICFGSSTFFPDNQLYEIASGIESSGHPFIWVIHGKDNAEESEEEREKWLPRGFEERIKRENKGMILRGWAPQSLILDHQAIGGFTSHCGWNSFMEGVCAGVPMITWPITAEQFYNEKLITQVHRIGVEVGSEEWAYSASDAKKKLVTRDRIEKAARRLMEGEEGIGMRRRVRELQEKGKAAVEEGGSSQRNLTALIEDLKRLRSIRSNAQDS